jgi:hypothetical protein
MLAYSNFISTIFCARLVRIFAFLPESSFSKHMLSPARCLSALSGSQSDIGIWAALQDFLRMQKNRLELQKFSSEPRSERRTPAPNAAFSVRVRLPGPRWPNVASNVQDMEGQGEPVLKRVRTPNATTRIIAPVGLNRTILSLYFVKFPLIHICICPFTLRFKPNPEKPSPDLIT